MDTKELDNLLKAGAIIKIGVSRFNPPMPIRIPEMVIYLNKETNEIHRKHADTPLWDDIMVLDQLSDFLDIYDYTIDYTNVLKDELDDLINR